MEDKTRVRRSPKRGVYDGKTIRSILKEAYLCHVAFVHEGYPVNIPTLYGCDQDHLYIHGATTSRLITDLESGIEVCVAVTLVDALVLARSAFHHSMNYRSVVVFGRATQVSPSEKEHALKVISDQVLPERWDEVRPPNATELKATTVLKIPLTQASAKVRTGPPLDEPADYDLPIWAGLLPVQCTYGAPIVDPASKSELPVAKSVSDQVGKKA